MKKHIRILFVCLGNICRSPLAEATLRILIEKHTLNEYFFVDSAGTSKYHTGELPDRRACAVAQEHGHILTHHARQLTEQDFESFDYIVAMDANNLRTIQTMYEYYARKHFHAERACPEILLYRAYDDADLLADVPDPYYGDIQDFRTVYAIVERTGEQFLGVLREQHGV